MSFSFKAITDYLAQWAPLNYAEDWDNAGLQVGDEKKEVRKLLLALTPSENIINQAVNGGYDAIITHHPLLFKSIKSVTPKTAEGRKIIKLIQNDLVLASFHTNLDIAADGVNDCLANALGLENVMHFVPMGVEKYYKIVVYVPNEFKNLVREAVCAAGCGHVGNYKDCTFQAKGKGTFTPLDGTNPFIGKAGELTYTDEIRLETIVPESKLNMVLVAMIAAHPYEEPAYDVYELAKMGKKLSIGRIGYLPDELPLEDVLKHIAKVLNLEQLGYSGDLAKNVRKIALCGGSGGEYLANAQEAGADLYLTGDVKFHDYQKAEELGIALADGGHFATEKFILPQMREYLAAEFPDLEIDIAEERDFKQIMHI